MEKRSCERVPSSLVVKFLLDNSACYGIATNISEKGMCIKSGNCLPVNSQINLQIPLRESHIDIPVKVMRVEQTGEFYDIMGVELTSETERYLRIVENFKITLKSV